MNVRIVLLLSNLFFQVLFGTVWSILSLQNVPHVAQIWQQGAIIQSSYCCGCHRTCVR